MPPALTLTIFGFQWLITGKIPCLAEGDGRNAVWLELAEHDNDVTGVDAYDIGLQKAGKLVIVHLYRGTLRGGLYLTRSLSDLGNRSEGKSF
ncbi:MAG: hypothetical protein ACI9KM_001600 [Rubritalea sp.]